MAKKIADLLSPPPPPEPTPTIREKLILAALAQYQEKGDAAEFDEIFDTIVELPYPNTGGKGHVAATVVTGLLNLGLNHVTRRAGEEDRFRASLEKLCDEGKVRRIWDEEEQSDFYCLVSSDGST